MRSYSAFYSPAAFFTGLPVLLIVIFPIGSLCCRAGLRAMLLPAGRADESMGLRTGNVHKAAQVVMGCPDFLSAVSAGKAVGSVIIDCCSRGIGSAGLGQALRGRVCAVTVGGVGAHVGEDVAHGERIHGVCWGLQDGPVSVLQGFSHLCPFLQSKPDISAAKAVAELRGILKNKSAGLYVDVDLDIGRGIRIAVVQNEYFFSSEGALSPGDKLRVILAGVETNPVDGGVIEPEDGFGTPLIEIIDNAQLSDCRPADGIIVLLNIDRITAVNLVEIHGLFADPVRTDVQFLHI